MKKAKLGWRIIILMLAICSVIVGKSYLDHEKDANKRAVSTKAMNEELVIPGGMPVGIYLETQGVMVLGTDKVKGADGQTYEPASHLVKSGDYITGVNGVEVEGKKGLMEAVKELSDENIILQVRRNEQPIEIKLKAVECSDKGYKLGIWVRDNVQGLGTITFLDSASRFGALGHGITDVDTNELVEISSGRLYETSISSIRKGKDGTPGGMEGIIVYNNYNLLGSINSNTNGGIFGTIEEIDNLFLDQEPVPIGYKEEIQKGAATIRCSVDGAVKEYEVLIKEVNLHEPEINKGIILEITDPDLLEITGGIVQGMSGSPIIQNGKIIGAVTHVFVQDAKKGYGIFIENMLKNVG